MKFATAVNIEKPPFLIEPCESMLFVGSCFADRIGARFAEERFPVTVNPCDKISLSLETVPAKVTVPAPALKVVGVPFNLTAQL